MNKLQLGSGFSNDDGTDSSKGEEAAEIKPDEESGDENENSADTADSENDESGDETVVKKPTKEDELKALLKTEEGIDTDLGDIDTQIAAARKRISEKRGQRRNGRELTQNLDSVIPPEEEEETDDLKDVDPDTLKLLERFTKAKGLVPKSELGRISYQTAHKTAENKFYETHPEYTPENDADDSLYKALKEELSYFATPKKPELISALFEKAHEQVVKKYPGKFKTTVAKKDTTVEDGAASARIKKQQLGGGSGGSGGGSDKKDTAPKTKFSDIQIRTLEDGGWTEEEIKALTSK